MRSATAASDGARRRTRARGPFDARRCLHAAFGRFGDVEDQELLLQVAAALAPRGQLPLDVTNHLGPLRRFPREVWRETADAALCERNTYAPQVFCCRRT